MRVIAGRAKGHRLVGPPGLDTRPMTDRTREALFSSLGAVIREARVLDLYAGSGALGIEALSRGAASATFVERDRRALESLRTNLSHTGLEGQVVASDVGNYLATSGERFDLAFVDPPYSLSLASVQAVLHDLTPLLSEEAQVILHRRAGEPESQAVDLALIDRRRYGDSELFRFERSR